MNDYNNENQRENNPAELQLRLFHPVLSNAFS
jgi:hypothetical protein